MNATETKSTYVYDTLLKLFHDYSELDIKITIFYFDKDQLPIPKAMFPNESYVKLMKPFPVQLAYDPIIWNEFAKSKSEYILYLKSTISAFPDKLIDNLQNMMLSTSMDGKSSKEFIEFRKDLLDQYLLLNKIDRDQPMNTFLEFIHNKTDMVDFRTYGLDDCCQDFPSWLYIEVCTKCNLSCEYCPQKYADDRTSIMSPETFEDILTKFEKVTHLFGVNLIGLGETMLHPKFLEIIKIIEKHGLAMCFTTNGTIWNKEVFEALPSNSIVYFSLDGVTNIPRAMRKVDPQVVIGNIKKLRALRPHLSIVIQPVLVKGFLNEALPYAKLAKELKVNIHPTVPVLGYKKDFDKLFPDDDETESADIIMKTITKCDNNLFRQPQYRSCFDPFNLLLVTIDGNVYPCCYINTVRTNKSECYRDYEYKLDTNKFILGNIFKDDLADIIKSSLLMKIRENICSTNPEDFINREKIDIQTDPLNYCKICLARWKKGC